VLWWGAWLGAGVGLMVGNRQSGSWCAASGTIDPECYPPNYSNLLLTAVAGMVLGLAITYVSWCRLRYG
jgi:hypothetical protein